MRIDALVQGRNDDPFALLGLHTDGGQAIIRVFAPDAQAVSVIDAGGNPVAPLTRRHPAGFFAGPVPARDGRFTYRLRLSAEGREWERADPYAFGPILGEMDEYLIAEGRHEYLYHRLGAHPMVHEGHDGTAFALWAPNAARVSVVGDFNGWDGRVHPMRKRGAGLWEIFLPDIGAGARYKYEILGAGGVLLPLKADPFAFAQELPPKTASIVHGLPAHDWRDDDWMTDRLQAEPLSAPISIYEVHLGSWRRGSTGEVLDYATLATQLADYARDMGFTHVELLPVSEHPFAGSWGYQPLGLFAPTARHGPPGDFAALVEHLHAAGIGVIVDWVPAHFPTDAHGLGRFDGTALYEHDDPRLGFHRDWTTLIYNFGRSEVANFLRASGLFWLDHYHVDALRVDAVASMLYRDYSRAPGEWVPNQYGGRENLEAVAFLSDLNARAHARFPGALVMAEESTAWPGVTHADGLGFDFKWNMGWMHDTLAYMSRDPIHRRYHHGEITFGIDYAFSENFILPLSHDEVVHGKGTLLSRMPGDRWQQFANLRAYFGFMWAHPGKKLLFMGGEFAQTREWNHDQSLDWHLLADPAHLGVQQLVRDLNHLYRSLPALYQRDCRADGFAWIEGNDADNNVFSFLRFGDDAPPVAVLCNFAAVTHGEYRIGVPHAGRWRLRLSTDGAEYGGADALAPGLTCHTQNIPFHGQTQSLAVMLPALATLILTYEG